MALAAWSGSGSWRAALGAALRVTGKNCVTSEVSVATAGTRRRNRRPGCARRTGLAHASHQSAPSSSCRPSHSKRGSSTSLSTAVSTASSRFVDERHPPEVEEPAQLRQLGPTIATVGVLDPCGCLLGRCCLCSEAPQTGCASPTPTESSPSERAVWNNSMSRCSASARHTATAASEPPRCPPGCPRGADAARRLCP